MDEVKKYRFFFHYRKSTGGMTVHFRNICYPCVNVVCNVPDETIEKMKKRFDIKL